MKQIKIGIIGYGNVGSGLVQALIDKGDYYRREIESDFIITAVVDLHKGCAYNSQGIPLNELKNAKMLTDIQNAEHPDWSAINMIHNADTDVIVELSYTDLKTGEPAALHIQEAILAGKNVVTSNKGPIALHYKMLSTLARENNVKIGIEGTVMSGTPAIRLGTDLLWPAHITEINGILNGTTNFILTEMESGSSFNDALKKAQELGIAEADPSGDIEGMDTAGKVAILSNLIFGIPIKPDEINRTGITDISSEDISAAKKINSRWKLIGSVKKKSDTEVEACVKPILLPYSNSLANVLGTTNAIQFTTDFLGQVSLIGPGAGRQETAFAILEDMIQIYNK